MEVDTAYAAGFFDGEGYIYNQYLRKRNYTSHRVVIRQVNRAPLDWLRERWGGHIGLERRQPPQSDIYRWSLEARRGRAFLRDVLPYLKVKQAKAQEELMRRNTP